MASEHEMLVAGGQDMDDVGEKKLYRKRESPSGMMSAWTKKRQTMSERLTSLPRPAWILASQVG